MKNYVILFLLIMGVSMLQSVADFTAYAEEQTARDYIEKGINTIPEYEKAIEAFTKALELEPKSLEAYSLRGSSYEELEQYEKAIQDYTQILLLGPQYFNFYISRGMAYRSLKKNKEAVDDLNRYLELAGNSPENASRVELVRKEIERLGYSPKVAAAKKQPAPDITAIEGDILSQLDAAASQRENTASEQFKTLKKEIEQSPETAAERILPRLRDAGLSEEQLTVYTWAIGLTKSPNAVQPLVEIAKQYSSQRVQWNCYQALASIGGETAGQFLLDTANAVSDADRRFELLNLLGEMQFTPALPAMYQLLEVDPKELYWQPIFAFGKMGQAAVPYLLEQINDPKSNVRANAIGLLGQWLIAGEAAALLSERYWKEEDTQLRALILSSVEVLYLYNNDLAGLKAFNEDLLMKEKDPSLRQFAQETLHNEQLQQELETYRNAKMISSETFRQAYSKLFASAGKDGDYDQLASASAIADEPALWKLRERILQRNSDEAFYNVQQVNQIIYMNRLTEN